MTLLPFVAIMAVILWILNTSPSFSQSGYVPSPAACAAQADRAARGSGTVLGGAARGAARGALFGAIIGKSKHAKRGAAIGAITGTVRGSARKNNLYNRVYDDCMRGMSYRY